MSLLLLYLAWLSFLGIVIVYIIALFVMIIIVLLKITVTVSLSTYVEPNGVFFFLQGSVWVSLFKFIPAKSVHH